MITALIFAGGTGTRMNSKTRPKQFLQLHGKPILIHTLRHFEEHPLIDNIALVCLQGWEEYTRTEMKRNFITKVKWLVTGGSTVQESIYNGLNTIYQDVKEQAENTIVLIHDGVRPLIDEHLITKNIETVKAYRSSITVSNATETIISIDEEENVLNVADRSKARIAKAPQCFYLNDIMEAHNRARSEGINYMIDSASLMSYYGYKLHTVMGSPYNIKITTPSDYYMFRALYEAKENSQIFGIAK